MKSLEQSQQALKNGNDELLKEKEKLDGQNKTLTETNQKLTAEKESLLKKLENTSEQLRQAKGNLAAENEAKDDLNNQLIASQKQVKSLENDKQVLNNEKIELSREKNDLTTKITELSTAKNDLLKEKENLTKANAELEKDKENLTKEKNDLTTKITELSTEKNELQQKHAPYDKLEKLYEVFLEVKGCLIFEFVKDTHSAMDLIGYVLSDSKYYVEELYKKTQQELRNKNSDKGEKLVALFDLLFECIKDKKFKRLEAPSSYNSACIALYPEQSSTGNIQRVVLRGYSYNDKTMPSIVDMGG